MANHIEGEHHKVGPTADLVSYWREFSDIPHAGEISRLANARQTAENIFIKNLPQMPPEEAIRVLDKMTHIFGKGFMEGRYKCIDKQIDRTGLKHIYEAASGISPRGINRTVDPSVKYLATDLPERLPGNEGLLRQIMVNHGIQRPNLYFAPVNVLDKEALFEAAKPLKGKPIAFIFEGLLPYFPNAEKQIFGENARVLLRETGGALITPDAIFRDSMQKRMESRTPEMRRMFELCLAAVYGVSGRSFIDNAFDNEAHADRFFGSLGGSVEKYSRYDGSFELSSLRGVPELAQEAALGALKSGPIYVVKFK